MHLIEPDGTGGNRQPATESRRGEQQEQEADLTTGDLTAGSLDFRFHPSYPPAGEAW